MKVLMSIKPKYANKIFTGEKLYELRRKIFQKKVSSIVVYSSSPIMMVIGEIEVEDIIAGTPVSIFQQFEDKICISRDDYFSYFNNTNIAYAIKIGRVNKYHEPKKLSDFGIKRAPQSYIYLPSVENSP